MFTFYAFNKYFFLTSQITTSLLYEIYLTHLIEVTNQHPLIQFFFNNLPSFVATTDPEWRHDRTMSVFSSGWISRFPRRDPIGFDRAGVLVSEPILSPKCVIAGAGGNFTNVVRCQWNDCKLHFHLLIIDCD